MKTSLLFAAALAVVAPLAAVARDNASASSLTEAIEAGRMLFDADGHPIGAIYRLSPAGDPQLIVDGRVKTVPTATLSLVGRKLTTSLSRHELERGR